MNGPADTLVIPEAKAISEPRGVPFEGYSRIEASSIDALDNPPGLFHAVVHERVAVQYFSPCPPGFFQRFIYPLELQLTGIAVCSDRKVEYARINGPAVEADLILHERSSSPGKDRRPPFLVELLSDLQEAFGIGELLLVFDCFVNVDFLARRPLGKSGFSHLQESVFVYSLIPIFTSITSSSLHCENAASGGHNHLPFFPFLRTSRSSYIVGRMPAYAK